MKKLLLILFFVLIFSCSVFGWWNANYDYKKVLTIETGDNYLDENYTVFFETDTATLIADGNMLSNCDDLRIYDANQSLELDRNITECNTATTKIALKLRYGLGASATDNSNFEMYYGYASATTPSIDLNKVFLMADTFSDGDATTNYAWTDVSLGGFAIGTHLLKPDSLQITSNPHAKWKFNDKNVLDVPSLGDANRGFLTYEWDYGFWDVNNYHYQRFFYSPNGDWEDKTQALRFTIYSYQNDTNCDVVICDANNGVGTHCNGGGEIIGTFTKCLLDQNWYHFKMIYDGNAIGFYIDGTYLGDTNQTKNQNAVIDGYGTYAIEESGYFDDFIAYRHLFKPSISVGSQTSKPLFGDINVVYPNAQFTFVSQLVADVNLLIQFDVNVNYQTIEDSNNLYADIYYSSTAGAKTDLLYDDLNLMCMAGVGGCSVVADYNCSDSNFDTQQVKCVADYNTFSLMDGNYYIDIEIFKDTTSLKTDSSDFVFTIDQNYSAVWSGFKDYGIFDVNSWQPFNSNPVALCDDSNSIFSAYSFAGSGCQLIEFQEDSDSSNTNTWGSTTTYASDTNFTVDGNWGLRVRATDWASNVSDWNTFFILLDKTVPDANTTDIFPVSNVCSDTDATPTFWLIVSDSKSGLSGSSDCNVSLYKNASVWATYENQSVSSVDGNCSLTNTGNPLSAGDDVYALWSAVDINGNRISTELQSAEFEYSADCTPAVGNGNGDTGGGGGGTGLRCADEGDTCVFSFDCCSGLKCVEFPDGVKRCATEIGINLIVSPIEIVPSAWINTLPDYELRLQPIYVLNDSDLDATVNFGFSCAVQEFCAKDWCEVIDVNDVFFSLPSRTERSVSVVCVIPSDAMIGATYSTALTFSAGTTQKSVRILIPVKSAVLGGVGEFLSEGVYCPTTSILKYGLVCFNENYLDGCLFSIGSEPFLIFDVLLPLGFALAGACFVFALLLRKTGLAVWLVLGSFIFIVLTVFALLFGCI